MVQW